MRILVAHNRYQLGGGEDVVCHSEAEILRSAGHDVYFHEVDNAAISTTYDKIKTFLSTHYNHRAKKNIAKIIDIFSPDVVHVHNFFPLLSPSIFDACRDKNTPTVMTLHNYRIFCPTGLLSYDGEPYFDSIGASTWPTIRFRPYRNSYLGTLAVVNMIELHKRRGTWLTKVDRFIAVSESSKSIFAKAGIPAEKIVVKSNKLLENPIFDQYSTRAGALYVGRLSGEKGVSTLIDAAAQIGESVCICGTGPELANLQQMGGGMTFLGHLRREDVFAQMQRHSFLVAPTVGLELFGMVVIEAYANGLPVIASRLGSFVDLVREGETGLLFVPGDAADLARVLRWAFDHPDEMARMGRNARLEFEARYTAERNLTELIAIYEQAIAEHDQSTTRTG